MRWSIVGLVPFLFVGCGEDSTQGDRVTTACGRILDAACAKYVECHVVKSGTPFTAELCAQVRSQAVASCASQDSAPISAGTDAQVDQCVSEMSQVNCADICNKVPADPPTCHELSPQPNTEVVTCAP